MNYRSILSIGVIIASVLFFAFYFHKAKPDVHTGKAIPLQLSVAEMDTKMSASLKGIEHEILLDYDLALKYNKADSLIKCINNLKQKDSAAHNAFICYWEAFALYKLAFFYSHDSCETCAVTHLKAAITLLGKNKYPGSEEWALLSILKSAYRRYAPVTIIRSLSEESIAAATHALQIDSQNVRTYLALGMNDFFTPVMFGGGTKAKAYLLKAIAVQQNQKTDGLLPEWGRDRAFFYLIKCCLNEGDTIAAQKYYRLAVGEFPNDTSIKNVLNE